MSSLNERVFFNLKACPLVLWVVLHIIRRLLSFKSVVTRVVDGHFVKSQLYCMSNMLKVTLLGGDTEVISIYMNLVKSVGRG